MHLRLCLLAVAGGRWPMSQALLRRARRSYLRVCDLLCKLAILLRWCQQELPSLVRAGSRLTRPAHDRACPVFCSLTCSRSAPELPPV